MGSHSRDVPAMMSIAFALVGCRTPTQVSVELTTDVPCSELPSTTARIGKLGAELESRAPSVATLACTTGGRIGSFVVAPSGDLGDEFAVKVVLAHDGSSIANCDAAEQNSTNLAGCIRARRALRFSPHDELTLPIALRLDCDNVLCPPTTTCVHGECRPATIPDPGLCRGAGCPDTVLPPGSPPDGRDAGPDAPPDVSDGGKDAPPDVPAEGGGDSEGGGDADACANDACPPAVKSCEKLPSNCGATANDSCCNSPLVTGGTFRRNDSVLTTVSDFRLNKYEVTIGRFRAFVDAVGAGYRPSQGSGKHDYLPGGGLVNLWDSGNLERGWDVAWNMYLPSDKITWGDVNNLSCTGTSWTSSPGANERKPVSCVGWFQAYAFCIWEGGFLPTFNEFNYARMGGDEQRPHPWGSEPITPERAVYCSTGDCKAALPSDVGSKPLGNGRYLQSDLIGNVSEFVLDGWNGLDTCKDCMFLSEWPPMLVPHVGGTYQSPADQLELSYMWNEKTIEKKGTNGFRCALPP